MCEPANSPKRGLPPEPALEQWSDKALYADMMTFAEARENRSGSARLPPTPYMLRHQEYVRRRKALEASFLEKLRDQTLFASAIAEWATARELIDPSLWDLLQVDYTFGEIVGDGRTYKKPEFFEPAAIPMNVRNLPEWFAGFSRRQFKHDATYQHIAIGEMEFTFGPLCAKVIELLHRAALESDGWLSGKALLADAGSHQSKMHDVFKGQQNWTALIESDGRGQYRLRLD